MSERSTLYVPNFVGWKVKPWHIWFVQERTQRFPMEIQQTFCWGNESDDWSWKEELVWADEGATDLPMVPNLKGGCLHMLTRSLRKIVTFSTTKIWRYSFKSWLKIQVSSLDIQPGHVWYFLRCPVLFGGGIALGVQMRILMWSEGVFGGNPQWKFWVAKL